MGVPPYPPREFFFSGRLFFSGEIFFSAVSGPQNSRGDFFCCTSVRFWLFCVGHPSKSCRTRRRRTNKQKIPPGIFFPRGDFFFVRRPRLPDVAGFFVRRVRLGFPFFGIQNWINFKLSGHPRFGHLSHFGVRGPGSGGGEDPGPRTPAVFGSH